MLSLGLTMKEAVPRSNVVEGVEVVIVNPLQGEGLMKQPDPSLLPACPHLLSPISMGSPEKRGRRRPSVQTRSLRPRPPYPWCHRDRSIPDERPFPTKT